MPSRNRKKRSKQRRPLYATATTQIMNLSNLLKGSDIKRTSRRTVLLKGSDIKRTSRRNVLLKGSDIKRTSTAHTASSSSRSSRSTATVLAPPAWLPWPEPGCRGQRRGLGRGRRQARGTVQYIKNSSEPAAAGSI